MTHSPASVSKAKLPAAGRRQLYPHAELREGTTCIFALEPSPLQSAVNSHDPVQTCLSAGNKVDHLSRQWDVDYHQLQIEPN